jgi:uncharacterized protein (DUF2252 family)
MAASPFAFFRGSAVVMANDLATSPTSGLRVQLCGDAHISNFGIFATPERDQVFDVNDFDETLPGPWEWDLKRLAASIVLAGRGNGFSREESQRSVQTAVQSYRERMADYAALNYMDVWYAHIDQDSIDRQVERLGRREFTESLSRAKHRTGLSAFPRLVSQSRGEFRIRDDPPLVFHFEHPPDQAQIHRFFNRYAETLSDERRMVLDRYRCVDLAEKVVGVGSVGTMCAVMLFLGGDDGSDPLFLQLKQANTSVLEKFAGVSPYHNHAQRVVVGQRSIQEASDVFLGWTSWNERDFYVRQLRDMKLSADIDSMGPKALRGHSELCGAALARAHARTGDAAQVFGYLGRSDAMDLALVEFAELYADQVTRDWKELVVAIKRGRLPAKMGQ